MRRSLIVIAVLSVALPAFGQEEAILRAVSPAKAREKPGAEPAGAGEAAAAEATQIPAKPPESLSSARATVKRFLADIKARKFASATGCLDWSKSPELTQPKREELAFELKKALDRIAEIDTESISDDPGGGTCLVLSEAGLPPVAIGRCDDGAWRFTPATVRDIKELYDAVRDRRPVVQQTWVEKQLPDWWYQTAFLLPNSQWIYLLLVIFAGIIADGIARFLLDRFTMAWLRFAKIDVDRKVEKGVWKPVGLLVRALTWYGGFCLLELSPQVYVVLLIAIKFFAVAAGIWTAFRLIDLLTSFLLRKAAATETKFDDVFIPLVSRSLKVFVTCVGLVTFAQAFGWPIAGLLSGLGLGGLALAFAAKDTLANLFGSVTVLVDRPFEIGDWVVTDGVEGTVETVGMRSTRIRTFYNSLITVPNSKLITATVDNMGRRRYRRIKTMLGLEYDTPPEKLDAFCEGVRELLRRHPYTRKDYYHVYFNQFSGSSLDVLLYCFLECPDWAVELRERHRLFCDILRLAEELGVSFAFPTRTLHMHQEGPGEPKPMADDDPALVGRRLAAEITGPPMSREDYPGVEYLNPLGQEPSEDGGSGE